MSTTTDDPAPTIDSERVWVDHPLADDLVAGTVLERVEDPGTALTGPRDLLRVDVDGGTWRVPPEDVFARP